MKVLILAGGSGTRLWPLSRNHFPKQFLELFNDKSLLRETSERFLRIVENDDLVVVTNGEYKFYVENDLKSCRHIILEPVGRNTAPAIALGVKYCLEKLECGEEELVFISPSDHVIKPVDIFAKSVIEAQNAAKEGFIVTFGIKPTHPETGYGYIQCDKSNTRHKEKFKKALRFTEKPDEKTASKYLKDGDYFWNSGMFIFSIKTILRELEKYSPQILKMLELSYDELLRKYSEMPNISIDYAVMEKSERVVTFPLDAYWNDIGSWDSLYEVHDKDESGNVKKGNVVAVDTKNTLVIGQKRLIATIGLEDYLVADTDDALLIAKKGETQKVKDVVRILKEKGAKEAEEHSTIYRPWGSYTILEEGSRYKIKRIVVNPRERISLQRHHHRSEHWVVVKGTAKVTIDDKTVFVHENESAFVPKSTMHRLENPGKIPLEIIEVQNGEYVGEDDIQRFEDDYGRKQG